MKLLAVVIAVLLCAPTFCLALQQSVSPPRVASDPPFLETVDSDGFFQAAIRLPRPARDNSRLVENLLARMTIEEKIGQMTQLEIGMVTTGGGDGLQIDPAKLEKAVVKYGVGSILNVKDDAITV